MMDVDVLKREATAWLVHLTSGEATVNDMRALQRWCQLSPLHAAAFDRARSLWQVLGPAAVHYVGGDAAALSVPPVSAPARHSRRAVLGGAMAAGAAGLAFAVHPPLRLWPSLADLTADYRTAVGEQRHIGLDDGGAIDLNTASALNIGPAGQPGRLELLTGEAAVTTAPGQSRPILIRAGGGEVSARAGSFNLLSLDGQVRVTCLAGAVAVAYRQYGASLAAGQQLGFGAGEFGPVASVDAAVVTAWRSKVLVFRDEPLERVIAEVNRYRPGRIVLMRSDIAGRQVNARFKLDSLDDVATQMGQVFDLDVRTLPGGIVLLA